MSASPITKYFLNFYLRRFKNFIQAKMPNLENLSLGIGIACHFLDSCELLPSKLQIQIVWGGGVSFLPSLPPFTSFLFTKIINHPSPSEGLQSPLLRTFHESPHTLKDKYSNCQNIGKGCNKNISKCLIFIYKLP